MARTLPNPDSARRIAPFDVVSVPFPYADRLAEKRRPALVISTSKLKPYGLIWVAMITSAMERSWSCDVVIPDLKRAGLPVPCVVRTAKVASLSVSRVERRAGRLDRDTIRAVKLKLRAFLDLT